MARLLSASPLPPWSERTAAAGRQSLVRAPCPPGPSREKLQVLASLKDNPSDRIMVFFPNDSPLGIAAITKFTEIMNTRDVNSNEPSVARGIIVYRDRVSSHARAVGGRACGAAAAAAAPRCMAERASVPCCPRHRFASCSDHRPLCRQEASSSLWRRSSW